MNNRVALFSLVNIAVVPPHRSCQLGKHNRLFLKKAGKIFRNVELHLSEPEIASDLIIPMVFMNGS